MLRGNTLLLPSSIADTLHQRNTSESVELAAVRCADEYFQWVSLYDPVSDKEAVPDLGEFLGELIAQGNGLELNPEIKQYLGLDLRIGISGVGDRIELWNPDERQKARDLSQPQYEKKRAKLMRRACGA